MFDPQTLPFYDHYKQELKGSQKSKARKLNQLGKIKRTGLKGFWKVFPIEGYNSREYTVSYDIHDQRFKCNCQYYQSKGKPCSHIYAVLMFEGVIEEENKESKE